MLLTELAQSRADILPLAFHVTYWDGGGWRDPFSLDAATARQRRYARILGANGLYTPQLVVAGQQDVVGSDRPAVLDALARAPSATVDLAVRRVGAQVFIEVGRGSGAGTLLLLGFDRQHRTAVGRGENGGRTLLETNIVRTISPVGNWTATAQQFNVAAPDGERAAVLLQAADGQMLGAAREDG